MTRRTKLEHRFVDSFPDELEDGVLYVSMKFATCAHLCCCGCGNQVITDISRSGWRLTYDGVSITLRPSVGNWSFPCKSHYWITNDCVEWLAAWSSEWIAHGRDRERRELERAADKTGRRVNRRPDRDASPQRTDDDRDPEVPR